VPARTAEVSLAAPVQIETTTVRREGRPRGRRFGALVHAALADVPLEGGKVEAWVRTHARRLGATAEEQTAAVEAVEAALLHPLLKRAGKSSMARREVPLLLPLKAGQLAEGVADLAFFEKGGWVVVDFKTDVELETHREEYERQLGVYALAISSATGQSASAWLLSV
jgi:ATP-dependent helicase/nuclease subunit A